jgi:hypothetical protein
MGNRFPCPSTNGSATRLSNLAISVSDPSFTIPAPTGHYFVRVKAVTPCGTTIVSNEVEVVVP